MTERNQYNSYVHGRDKRTNEDILKEYGGMNGYLNSDDYRNSSDGFEIQSASFDIYPDVIHNDKYNNDIVFYVACVVDKSLQNKFIDEIVAYQNEMGIVSRSDNVNDDDLWIQWQSVCNDEPIGIYDRLPDVMSDDTKHKYINEYVKSIHWFLDKKDKCDSFSKEDFKLFMNKVIDSTMKLDGYQSMNIHFNQVSDDFFEYYLESDDKPSVHVYNHSANISDSFYGLNNVVLFALCDDTINENDKFIIDCFVQQSDIRNEIYSDKSETNTCDVFEKYIEQLSFE